MHENCIDKVCTNCCGECGWTIHLIWAVTLLICVALVSWRLYAYYKSKLEFQKSESANRKDIEDRRFEFEKSLEDKQPDVKEKELKRRIDEFKKIALPSKVLDLIEKGCVAPKEMNEYMQIIEKIIKEYQSNNNIHE